MYKFYIKILQKVKNKIHREGFTAFLVAAVLTPFYYRRHLAYKKMLKTRNIKERFDLIYRYNLWGSKESGSGKGSEVSYTKNIRDWLITAIHRYSIKTLVDAPCGDFNWMKLVTSKSTFNYIGLDIVDSVITKNKQNYESETIKFYVANICTENIPSCDLLIVRDCLFHLSYEDINSFLRNISRTDFKYLLTTTHIVPVNFKNYDIKTGDFRLISLFHTPFCFKYESVIEFIQDYPDEDPTPRKMILVAKKDIPVSLALI